MQGLNSIKILILKNFSIRFSINLILQMISISTIWIIDNPIFYIPSTLILGLCMVNSIELVHECIHNTAFKNKILNKVAGTILSAPVFISFSLYRSKHLWHHNKIGTKEDAEFFQHTALPKNTFEFIKNVFNPTDIIKKIFLYYSSNFEKLLTKKNRIESVFELSISLIIVSSLAYCLILNKNIQFPLLYIFCLFGVFTPVHHLVEFPEHAFCETNAKSIVLNTRSITGGFWSTWFTNYNNFHVEHHKFPNVQFHQLIDIHQSNKNKLKYTLKSYFEFYNWFWKQLRTE